MNERIQELLIEAHKQTDGGIYNGHLSVWTEKFAQLIVRECAGKVDWILAEGGKTQGDLIRGHFGVEL
jgi:hypothetical protein